MTQSELRIYINTAAAEAMKDLRRMQNEIAKLEASAKSMRAAARGSGAGTFFSAADIASAQKMNAAITGVTNSARASASSTAAAARANSGAAAATTNLTRAKELSVIASQKLASAEAIAQTKMDQGTASATQMAAAYGRVAAAAGTASAAQMRLAASQAAMSNFGAAANAEGMAASLLNTQKGYIGLQREMGIAAARGDEFGHRTTTSLFDTLAAINDNESAMRKWGSQIQWTGRQMISNLTMPIAMVAGMGGKVWYDQETALVGLAKVYGDINSPIATTEAELDSLGKKFTELSNIFGINREEVANVATDWAAAGASGVELAKATNLTMQAMVLGNLSAEESTKALIATQAQYGFSVDEMSKTLAQFNFVENETGVTMGGLIQAFSRTAGVAREAGMDTAHLASMIAAMTPAAGSASEAGNGLKTIMTRLMRQTKDTTGTLELMNINVKEFASLPMDQKLMEVAKGFENLDDAQKGAAAGILAGGWQVNRMSVAMRELTNETGYYHKALRGLNDDNKVQQVMVRELTKQLTSDPKKLQQAWQRLRNSMAQIFVPIVPYLLYFANAVAEVAQKFSDLPVPIQKITVAVGLFLALLGPIIVMLGVFALVASSLKTPFMIIGTILGFLVKGPFVALGAALTSGTGLLGTFGAATMRAAAFTKVAFSSIIAKSVAATSAFISAKLSLLSAAVTARFAAMSVAALGFASTAAKSALTVAASFAGTMASSILAASSVVIARAGAMAAAVMARYAAMATAIAAHALSHIALTNMQWLGVIAAEVAGWAKQKALTAYNLALSLAMNARHWAARVLLVASSFNLMAAGLLTHWAKLHIIDAAGWAKSTIINSAGALKNYIAQAWPLDMLTIRMLGEWAKRHAIEAMGWAKSTAINSVGALKNYVAQVWPLDMLTIRMLGEWAKRHVIDAVGWAKSTAINAAGAAKTALSWIVAMDMITVKQLIFWAKTNLMTKVGIMTMLRTVGTMMLRVLAVFVSPWGLAIAAVLGLIYVFRDQIRAAIDGIINYFQNMPPAMAAALQPLVNLWNKIVGGAKAAFNSLPAAIQAPLVALVKMVKTAALKVYELFSYINPFARHSPSLVENVNKGLDAVAGRFSLAATQIRGSVGRMYDQIKELKNASAGLSDANASAKREEDIGKISRAGIGNPAAQIQSYNALDGTVATLKRELDSVSISVNNQQRKVDSLSAAMKRADAAIEGMGEGLDKLKERADAVGSQLDAAKERVDYFKNATIAGMGAAEDAAFANEIAQKKLQLQMKKLGDAATEGTDKARDQFAKLQGDIEVMSGQKMELQFAGAGSDVLGGYDSMINGLKGQQLEIGVGINQTGPAAQVDALQKQLDELQRQAEIMDLEKALKFDPLSRQIEKVTSDAYELPFNTIISGISSSGAQVDSLTSAYDRANAAVSAQQSAIDSAQKARDDLAKTYDAESEALDSLKSIYDGIEGSIRDGEQALNDMVSSADTAIQRIEEMERVREEATRKAEKVAKGEGGEDGSGGTLSPNMQSLMNAAGSDPFPEVGGGLAIGRDESYGLDQSGAIDDFDLLSANGLEGLLGDVSMLGPFKKAWQGVKDWWSGIVLPLGDPVKSVGDEVGNIIQGAFGADSTGPLSTFMEKVGQVGEFFKTLWNIVKGFGELLWGSIFPAIKELGENLKNSLGSELSTIGNLFKEHWPSIKKFGEALWEFIKIVGIIVGVVTGVLIGAIILVISIVANIASEILPPIIAFIGAIIEAVINVVMGIVEIITGLWNIIIGLFTGDWGRVWDGIKLLGQGIWNIIKGIWDAIVAIFKGAWDLVFGIVKGFVEGIIDFFTTLWDVLVGHSIVPDMIIAIIDWFKSLPGKVLEFVGYLVDRAIWFFNNLWEKTVEIVGGLIDGVVGFFMEMPGRVWNTLVDLKNKILGFFGTAKDWLFDAGKNIIDGLLDGAGSLLSKLGNFFADKIPAGIIRDGFKKALGIQSPAREMMPLGANVIDGIIVGAESRMPGLDSLMDNAAQALAGAEIAAPVVQAAGVALPAAVDAPVQAAAPVVDAPQPIGITPEQSAAAIAAFTAFDVQYRALVLAHTTAVALAYTTMNAGIVANQTASNAAMLAAQATFAAAFVASVVSMSALVVAQFVSMTMQVSALFTSSTASWLATVAAFIASILAQWAAYIANLVAQTTTMVNNITGLWQTLANNLGNIVNDSIRPVFDSFLPMLETLEGWFRTTVDNIGAIWGEVEPKTKGPARVVINDVYNDGLRGAWNSFNEFLGLKELPAHTAKFAAGGVMPGYTPGRDVHKFTSPTGGRLELSGGEAIMRPEWTRAVGGPSAVHAMNAAARSGRLQMAQAENSANRQAFAGGGVVGAMDRIVKMKYPQMVLTSGGRSSADLHGSGMAGDFAWPGAFGNHPAQLSLAHDIAKTYPNSMELIYDSPGWNKNIKNGQIVGPFGQFYTMAQAGDHSNHVHWAMNTPPTMPFGGGVFLGGSGGEGAGGMAFTMDWGEYMGDAFKQAMDPIRDKMPKFDGGIGQWPIKAIEKVDLAKDFLIKKAEEMVEFQGDIDDSSGMVERWRPMMKAALIKQGLAHWANDPAILDRFMRQIDHESSGVPNVTQGITDINSGGNEAEGLAQIAKSTWVGARDPSLPDDWHNPWSNLNAMARYVRERYGPQGYLSIGNGIGYDSGGVLPATPGGYGTFYNHTGGPEAVLTSPQWDAVYRAAMATTEAEEVARGFRNAVLSGEYNTATGNAAKQVVREFGPAVDELNLGYFDSAKLIADVAAEEGLTWRETFTSTMEGVQKFFGTVSDIYATGKGIYDKLEEDGVIKEIEESTEEQVAALKDIANRVQSGAEINEALLHEVGGHLAIFGQKAFEILAKQPFETYAPIFDKLADLADMLPKAGRSYVPWAGLETDMTIGKSLELGMTTIGNGVKGLYNIVQGVASPILRNVSGIGGVLSRFATENTGAVSAIMAAVATGNPLLALPFLPQILDALFELIPMVIQAIIDIVPNLIQAIIDFFDFLNPWNVPSYDSLEEAVKASNDATADVRSGKYQYERGANSDWRPSDDGTKEMNFYGDLSFPNIKSGDDASEFVGNLKKMG